MIGAGVPFKFGARELEDGHALIASTAYLRLFRFQTKPKICLLETEGG